MLTAKHVTGLLVSAVLAADIHAQALSAYPYKASALIPFAPGQGSGVALMIDDRGLVCGFLSSNAGFCEAHGRVTQLVPLPGDAWATPAGLNGRGQVVGVSYGPDRPRKAVIFVNGAAQSLAVDSHMNSDANDINDLGQVVGGFGDVQDQSNAYLLSRGVVRALGSLGGERHIDAATGINDRGQVVGQVSQPGTPGNLGYQVAFLYQDGVMRALPTPAGHTSLASRINLRGQAVGLIQADNGGIESIRPVLWERGGMKVLADRPADARGINLWGQVVGAYLTAPGGYLYQPGRGARDLNTLIDPSSGFTISYPQAINDRGDIVGYGCKERLCGPILLSFEPRLRRP